MQRLHRVQDEAKVARLIEAMARDGWQGAPLVVDGDQLLTGVHRYEAAMRLGWTDAGIPTIDLTDLFAAAGLDLAARHAEYGYPTVDEPGYADLIAELPEEVREEYGIDLH